MATEQHFTFPWKKKNCSINILFLKKYTFSQKKRNYVEHYRLDEHTIEYLSGSVHKST